MHALLVPVRTVYNASQVADTLLLAQVAVRAVGLNFRDLLNVLGMYPGDPGLPGGDCAGIITALGPGAYFWCPIKGQALIPTVERLVHITGLVSPPYEHKMNTNSRNATDTGWQGI